MPLNQSVLTRYLLFLLCLVFTGCQVFRDNSKSPRTGKINLESGKTTNTYVVVYNFATKMYDSNFVRPRINHPVVFKIANINRFAYDVTITSRDSVLIISEQDETDQVAKDAKAEKPEVSPEITPTTPLNIGGGDVKNQDKVTSGKTVDDFQLVDETMKLGSLINKLEKRLLETESQLLAIQKDSLVLKLNAEVLPKLSMQPGANKDSVNMLITQIAKQQVENTAALKLVRVQIENDSTSLEKLREQLNKIVIQDGAIKEYSKKLSTLQSTYSDLLYSYRGVWKLLKANKQLTSIATQPLISSDDFLKACKDSVLIINDAILADYRNYIGDFYDRLNDFYQHYEIVMNDFDIVRVLTNEGVAKIQAGSRSLKLFADKMSATVKGNKPNDIIDKMAHIYHTMIKREAYEIISAPIQPSQDLVVFDIAVSQKNATQFNDSRKFSYREYVRQGLRYDFSTGLVFTFGLDDFTYNTQSYNGSTDSVSISVNKSTNQYLPSLAAMFHGSFRTWRNFAFGFTLGATISTSNLEINSIFPGLSVMIGKREKIIFTAGPALKNVKYLDSKYTAGNKAYASSEFPTGVPVTTAFRVGSFVGISYNLTKKQKSNFKLLKD